MKHQPTAVVSSVTELTALYPSPSSQATNKTVSELSDALQLKIEQSSLCVIASTGPNGIDCSPRGDAPGNLIKVLDARTVAIPDRPGSNRLDTAKNVIANGQIGLWCLSSQWEETVRISGDAHISTDAQLLKNFELNQTLPVTVMVIAIHQVAVHNNRAVKFSGLID